MKKHILLILCILSSLKIFSQQRDLIVDIQFIDYPYQKLAAACISRTYPNFNIKPYHYFYAYTNPSMSQSLAISTTFSNAILLALSKINYKISSYNLVNALYYTLAYTAGVSIIEYNPLGLGWLHEEFHRAVLTKNFVNSFNEANKFKYFSDIIRVYNVSDEDLIRMKAQSPQDFIRLHEAGIEGENAFAFRTYKYNFFYNQNLPYAFITSSSMLNSFYYIYFCQTKEAEITTNEENKKDGKNIKIRDFTGLDFTAWVYDLNHPFEAYQARGIHPSGIGINRYIKPSDLRKDELKLLRKEAFLHLLNTISPFFIGINRIKLKNSEINFSFRHLLTSFGDDIGFYFYYKKNKINLILALHKYSNKYLNMPGIEAQIIAYPIDFKYFTLYNHLETKIWTEPENLLYYDNKSFTGGSIKYKLEFVKKYWAPYIEVETKTKGWEAGNIFQEKNFSIKFGLSLIFNFQNNKSFIELQKEK